MRALTVRQPWAWAITQLAEFPTIAKGVENRSSGFPKGHRGPLAIHAAVGWSERGGDDDRVKSLWVQGATWGLVGPLDHTRSEFVRGAVVAVVDVADVHTDTGCCRPWGESVYVDAEGDHARDLTHLVLENCREVDPVPCRGKLGLWTLPDDVAEAVSRQAFPSYHAMADQHDEARTP